ncbi:MAG: hypothetical protein JXP48_00800 [Acidobacteria bacterium]|nr:hypothetical protein [Acidobacteriota bacterium]
MTVLSLIWGILALVGLGIGFIPCLGSLNWLNIPFAGIGLIVGILALLRAVPEKRGGAIAGVVLCAIAVVLGVIRLILGGGIL